MPIPVSSKLAWAVPFVALLACTQGHAMNSDEAVPALPPASSASHATRLDALDLRLPPRPAQPSLATATGDDTPAPHRINRTMRLEPRKSFIEWGVEGSREALIACQKGPYPGATVAAYTAAQTMGTEAQPDHCHRF